MEILSNEQINEGEDIEWGNKRKISSIGDLLGRFQKPKENQKKKERAINTEEQFLVKEIYEWSVSLGTPIKHSMLYDMIQEKPCSKGKIWVRQCWEEVKHFSFPYQSVGTFINKVNSVKIIWDKLSTDKP